MYNPIQIIFKCNSIEKNMHLQDRDLSVHILPYPNQISISNLQICLPLNVKGFLKNISASHDLLKQIQSEMEKDFQINVEWERINLERYKKDLGILNSDQEKEGYVLNIESEEIIIQAASLNGLFYGFQSLRQILLGAFQFKSENSEGFILPQLNIVDWPCLKIRGIADDISRGQVPTIESAKHFIRDISRFKNNYYALYMEDMFKCSKHPKIGKNRGAFTPEELIELDRYAKSRFVTLIPIFETLGHFDNILTIPEYQNLGEFPGAQCLSIANGNIYPLLRDFIGELSPCFSSKMIHIGGDESFDFGKGNSKDLIDAVGMDRALLDHYRKIYNISKESGNEKMIIYHDVVMKYPLLLNQLPKDLIFMYWDYVPKKNYVKLKRIVEEGFPVIVSPSMLCWSRHFPNYNVSAVNIINLIEYAKGIMKDSDQILGQLNSTWGDFSNHNLRENNIYGAILSGTASWTISKVDYKSFIKDLGYCFFGLKKLSDINDFYHIFFNLTNINKFYQRRPRVAIQNFYNFLYRHPFFDEKLKPNCRNYKKILTNIVEIISKFNNLNGKISINFEYLPYIEYSIKIAQIFAEKDVLRVNINSKLKNYESGAIPTEIKEEISKNLKFFKQKIKYLLIEYERLWKFCAKEPNLQYPLTKFKNLYKFIEEKEKQIENDITFINPLLPSAYIWTNERISYPKSRYFRKEIYIEGKILEAKIQAIIGNFGHISINGEYIGTVSSRFSLSILPLKNSIRVFDIKNHLKTGKNIIEIDANHYLETKGFLNIYMVYKEEKLDKSILNHEIISDSSWMYIYDKTPIEKKWKSVKVLGYSPKINSYIYKPSLLDGERSYTEDTFGFKNRYYFISLIFGKFLAKIIRFFIA
ncbi:family 20 glycosylhydrolase [Promethearchaeum syntrophicum]|uniref:beta-N-acetylhexosaminidase n=1 Tax=Promethearchaeum syntrophicum TaxID=2594042 RepID=A0A5B9D8Q0_9ARCH|nr:family 20 glycosylhydrolase [Candidatus Prometheoarchaeum syntrophicum]QEE15443.1 Glycosyl hydrolase family 20, catalytic domain [Candidatus Prometheoarchaeum syntrophicum]